jgi:LysM repeat protein
MAGAIGIKIANGDFYPIMEGDSTVKKRLVLTTVHDSQESVQIDFYRSVSKSMLDAQYIGTLLVGDIRPRPRGEPSIEMVISATEDGIITADACDLDAGPDGEHHTLSVSLTTSDPGSQKDSLPDFDLGSKPQVPTGLYGQAEFEKTEKRKFPWLIAACASIFVIILIALLWFFLLDGRDMLRSGQAAPLTPPPVAQKVEPVAPPPEPPPPPPPPPPEPPPVVEAPKSAEPVVIEAPITPPPARPQTVERKRPPAPVSSYKVPAVIPRNGVAYQIRWGDTLWDISEAFYRNPWLYPRIARHNNIRNPDLIIAGRTIRIPPRN